MRKTTLFGFNMERRPNRRRLVVVVYAVLSVLLVGGWYLDRFGLTGSVYVYFIAMFLNWKVLGGYGPKGLVKPFTGEGPSVQPMPSNLVELELYAAGNLPGAGPDEYRNDERELARRDRVHYQAYQVVALLLCPIWFIAQWEVRPPRFVPAGLLPMLLEWIALPAVLLAVTLPQAIILWTEPDVAADFEEEPALTASR